MKPYLYFSNNCWRPCFYKTIVTIYHSVSIITTRPHHPVFPLIIKRCEDSQTNMESSYNVRLTCKTYMQPVGQTIRKYFVISTSFSSLWSIYFNVILNLLSLMTSLKATFTSYAPTYHSDEQYWLFACNTIWIPYWLHNDAIQYNNNTRGIPRKISILVLNIKFWNWLIMFINVG